MRIMDIQQFKVDQFEKYRERRTSQLTRFLDKNIDFVTYFSINKALSTAAIGNLSIDSYIGKDSPVRYNRINNLPIYGFPVIDTQSSYDEDNAGFTLDDFNGEFMMLPNIIEPCEGDCFILNIFDERRYFQVNEVRQTVVKSKPGYTISFHIGIPDYLNQLYAQVVEEYNAIYDNIGTHDKVIVSKNEYTLIQDYTKIYTDIVGYYLNAYFKPKTTMFEVGLPMSIRGNTLFKYVDKYLINFMIKNRVVVMDNILKSSLVLDNNYIYDDNDFLEYTKTLYYAIENKRIDKMTPANYVELSRLISPFSLLTGQTNEEYFSADKYCVQEPEANKFCIEYNFAEISDRIKRRDISIDDTAYSKVLSIIVNYMKDIIIMPGYFSDLCEAMNPLQEYTMLPVILFIMAKQISGLRNRNSISI